MLILTQLLSAEARYLPPNPLGTSCQKTHYAALNNPAIVMRPFDIKYSAVLPYDPEHPPSYLDLARAEVGKAWGTFIGRACEITPYDDPAWAGECRVDVSEIRDQLSVFANIYPADSPKGQYKLMDPWRLVQENISHYGYHETGDYLDCFSIPHAEAQRAELYHHLQEWWRWYHGVLGPKASNPIYPGGPTWDNYVRLQGQINSDGSTITSSNLVYTPRSMTRQFWGYTDSAKANYGGYENLALLMKVQENTAMGDDDSQYDLVMTFTDLTNKTRDDWIEYQTHEEYHDLRKQIRSMWKTLEQFPHILPLAWYPSTIPGAAYNLWDRNAFLAAQINGRYLRDIVFENSDASKAILQAQNWPDALIELATAICLGGYFHVEYGKADNAITQQGAWDFVQRFGYINDIFMSYKYKVLGGSPKAELDAMVLRINNLWASLKTWLIKNDLKSLLRVASKYLPAPLCAGFTEAPTKAPTVPTIAPSRAPTTPDITPEPTKSPVTEAPTTKTPTQAPTTSPTIKIPTPAFPTNLPIFTLNTLGVAVPSAKDRGSGEVKGILQVYYNKNPNADTTIDRTSLRHEYDVIVKERGKELRQLYPKRTFGFTTVDTFSEDLETPILEFPAGADWYLKGPYIDSTLLKDPLAYELATRSGNYASRYQLIELYLVEDGAEVVDYDLHYQGVYILEEKVKRDKMRVNIKKFDEKSFDESGLIMAVLHMDDSDDHYALEHGGNLQLVYPGSAKNGTEHLGSFLQQVEQVLFDNNVSRRWLHPTQGYQSLLNVGSFVDYFLHSEVVASADAYLYNVYMYYDGGHDYKLHMGPVSGFDLSFGFVGNWMGADGGSAAVDGWRYEARIRERQMRDPSQWYGRLLSDPFFKRTVIARWQALRKGAWSDRNISAMVADLRNLATARDAADRNFNRWPNSAERDKTYPEVVSGLEDWIMKRVQWIDQNIQISLTHTYTAIGTTCDVAGVKMNEGAPRSSLHRMEIMSVSGAKSGVKSADCPTDCPGPWPYHPVCAFRMQWLAQNWETDPAYAQAGIDGTTCSFQKYLNKENPAYCPAACNPGCDTGDCPGPFPGFPECDPRMIWLSQHWAENPALYPGVTGSTCSILAFLHNESAINCPPSPCVEPGSPTAAPTTKPPSSVPPTLPPSSPPSQPPSFTPTAPTMYTSAPTLSPSGYVLPPGFTTTTSTCVGTGNCMGPWPGYPNCQYRMAQVAASWKTDPIYKGSGIDGSTCSMQLFIAREFRDCPMPPAIVLPPVQECKFNVCQDPNNMFYWGEDETTPAPVPNSPMHPGTIAIIILVVILTLGMVFLGVRRYSKKRKARAMHALIADDDIYTPGTYNRLRVSESGPGRGRLN